MSGMQACLRHEHLITVNEPDTPHSERLTREQLRFGLRHTVEVPQTLDPSIDAAHVRQLAPGVLARAISRGALTARDEVHFKDDDTIEIRADAAGAFAGSRLTIRIEEPTPQMLCVRFTYLLYGIPAARDEKEDAARRSAYEYHDAERIRAARRHAASASGYLQ
jgi:hypothetical protein